MSRFAGSIIHESGPDKPKLASFLSLPKRVLGFLWWGTPELSATYSIFADIHGTVDILKLDYDLVAGKPFDFQIRVRNSQNGIWPQHGKIDIHLRWTTPNSDGTDSLLVESWNHHLPCLHPGTSEWIQATSTVPENAPVNVLVEFYISSLEGVWRNEIGTETRVPRIVRPREILGFKKLAQTNPTQDKVSRAA